MKPANDDQVVQAETALGLKFSEDFRKYVREFGVASFFDHELTGICEHKRLNVIDVTLEEREYSPGISRDWYVVEQTNFDGIVIWQSKDGTIYQSAPNATPQKKYDSLAEYIGS